MLIGIDASRANKTLKTGTEWYSYYLIKQLAQIDHQNQYELYFSDQPSPELNNLGPNFHNKILGWPPRKLWTQIRLSAHLFRHAPDVLFVPAHTIPWIHPKNTVTTCHDIGFKVRPELYSPQERKYQEWSLRLAIKGAKKIIAVSNFTKKELLKNYPQARESQIEVIYHGYNSEVFKPVEPRTAAETANKYGLTPDNYLIYIGRLENKKNTLGLIKAFELINDKN
ncbi:glycosyltransferase, partial [Candidatus Uhrbacteria bacterium]|nr:glycosyltransferase [Candidatus Uhrbacteria bacterium]